MQNLEENQEIKVVPLDIKNISNGYISSIKPKTYLISLEKNKLSLNDFVEIIAQTDTCIIKFKTKVTAINGNQVEINSPKKTYCIQRREYTRVYFKIPMEIKNIYEQSLNAECINISGGGIQFKSDFMPQKDKTYSSCFKISTTHKVEALLELLRIEKESSSENEYISSAIFKKISNADRIAIVQFCFKRKLELNCKLKGELN